MNRRTFFRWTLRAGTVLAALTVAKRIKVTSNSLAQWDDNMYGPAGHPYPGPTTYKPAPSRPPRPYPWPAAQTDGDQYPLGPSPTVTADSEVTGQPKPTSKAEKPRAATRAPRK